DELYGRSDTDRAMRQFETVDYGRDVSLGEGIEFSLANAGHLLGSAMVHLRVAAPPRDVSLTFTGDLGRRHLPLHGSPAPAPAAELSAAAGGPVGDLFGGDHVTYLRAVEESKALNDRREPCVIVAAGGMCEAGRILHHLKLNIDFPRASVVLVSFQAPLTVG